MSSSSSILAGSRVAAVAAFLFTVGVLVASASVDPTFNAVPSGPLTTGSGMQQVVQPDGKIILYGPRMVVDGIAKGDIVRLNPDGTADPGFSYCGCGLSYVRNLELALDGKIIVAGGEGNNAKIIRLNSDGSLDNTFSVFSAGPPPFFGNAEFSVHAVQPDGKVFAMFRYSSTGHVSFYLDRYNADGSVDSDFPRIPLTGGSPMSASLVIELLPDGRFYMALTAGVTGTGATLTRRNANGSVDSTWEAPSFQPTGFGSFTNISDLELLADNGVLVAGNWETVNGLTRRHLIKLQAAGNVDVNFTSPTVVQTGHSVEILSDGKLLFSGRTDISGTSRLFRLNSDGTTDNTFVMDVNVTSVLNAWRVDPSGRIIFLGATASGPRLVRLLSTGALDAAFNPNLTLFASVNTTAVQSDGKVLLAGIYSQMNGVNRSSFARVNADGSLDATFDPGSGFSNPPGQLIIQPDGKILAAGGFTSYNGVAVPGIVRINANGTIDNSFIVSTSSNVQCAALQPDGKILIGGAFSTVNGVGRTGVARLESDGSLDASFNVVVGSPSIQQILVQPNGQILIGGTFTGVNGFNRNNFVRLDSNGALDQTFTASVGTVAGLWRQADGRYVILTGSPATTISRRNSDGSADGTFTPPAFATSSSSDLLLHSVLIMADGSMLVGGRFDTVAATSRPNIVRLAPNGTLDPLFLPSGANGRVRSLTLHSAGKAIAGGSYSTIGTVVKSGVARLNVPAYVTTTPFDFDGDGRADVSVYRPSSGVWYQLFSSGNPYGSPTFGLAGDIPVPADFDGDGKTDLAIYRPSSGDWWYRASSDNSLRSTHWGTSGDIPLPADINNDGRDDFVVFRPSTNFWYRITIAGAADQMQFGLSGDRPVIGDFDGDGKADQAIFRPSSGDWWYAASSAGGAHRYTHWGQNGDIPSPADYDGDGKTDHAVFRPSNGGWYVLKSSDQSYTIIGFGLNGDRPAPADYDGDGRADIAVFRPSTGVWYVMQSTGGITGAQWGVSTDVAIPSTYLPQ